MLLEKRRTEGWEISRTRHALPGKTLRSGLQLCSDVPAPGMCVTKKLFFVNRKILQNAVNRKRILRVPLRRYRNWTVILYPSRRWKSSKISTANSDLSNFIIDQLFQSRRKITLVPKKKGNPTDGGCYGSQYIFSAKCFRKINSILHSESWHYWCIHRFKVSGLVAPWDLCWISIETTASQWMILPPMVSKIRMGCNRLITAASQKWMWAELVEWRIGLEAG